MTKEQYDELVQLCFDKRAARKAGYDHAKYADFYKKHGLGYRQYGSGKIAEVAICYLLGYFQSLCSKYFSVRVSVESDQCGTDYAFRANGREYRVQQKFAKKNYDYYPDCIVVIELGADKSFTGTSELPPENGNVALFRVLVESGAFTEEEVYDAIEDNEEFEKICVDVWRSIKKV